MKVINTISLIFLISLLGCAPDLYVRHLGVTWDEPNKNVEAEIENRGGKDAGSFSVHIKAVEDPESIRHKPEINIDVAGLAKNKITTVNADLAPLAHPDNDNLGNVHTIRVVVDPDNTVKESKENNNVKEYAISRDVVVPLTPDPLCPSGDELYEIYRRGFIGRHLASNGRVLQAIGLESVDEASGDPNENPAKDYWVNFAGRIPIETSAGHRYSFHPDNVRYSYEESTGVMKTCTTPDSELVPRLWVPMMGPMKEQGMSNSGYYVISGNGDNPSYYGGMALAMFSLEHRYGVSDHSLEYARKLVEYFAAQEMEWRKGYIIRTSDFFPNQLKIRGASSEELLGIMLGIMFYRQVEDENDPHYAMAEALSRRIRTAVERNWGYYVADTDPLKMGSYWHPFMSDTGLNDAYYFVKHFEYPLNVTVAEQGGSRLTWMTSMKAAFAPIVLCRTDSGKFFDNFVLYSISTMLVLEGTTVHQEKVDTAEFFMRNVIKPIVATWDHDCDAADWIRYNGLLGTMALWTSKYLDLHTLMDIWEWGEPYLKYWEILTWADIAGDPISGIDHPFQKEWQHNLPLDLPHGRYNSLNHNPRNGIGHWFAWIMRNKNDTQLRDYNVWKRSDHFLLALPGWDKEFVGTVNDFVLSDAKKYNSAEFPIHELCSERGHCNSQVEGAGLGLLFLRMLLTHIDADKYPVPQLTNDRWIRPLQYPGPNPLSPVYLKAKAHDATKHVGGDTDFVISAARLDHRRFATASEDTDSRLRLRWWEVTPDGNLQHGVDRRGSRIDRVVSTNWGSRIITAERAEGEVTGYDHWLRLSAWADGRLEHQWESSIKDRHAVKSLDVDVLAVGSKRYPVVLFKSKSDIDRLLIFSYKAEKGFRQLTPGINVQEGTQKNDKEVHLTTIGDLVVYSVYDSIRSSYRLYTRRWTGRHLSAPIPTAIGDEIQGELLDIEALTAKGGCRYVIAAYKRNDGVLGVSAWHVGQDGSLGAKKDLITSLKNNYRVPTEMDYVRAKIVSLSRQRGYEPLIRDSAFAIVGRGVAAVSFKDDQAKLNDLGLKVLFGRVLPNGKPTLESFSLAGGHKMSSALDGVGPICVLGGCGLVSVHKAGSKRLNLLYWQYNDPHRATRWSKDGQYQICEYPSTEEPQEVDLHIDWWHEKDFTGTHHRRELYFEENGRCRKLVHNDAMKSIKFFALPGWRLQIFDSSDCKMNDDWGEITFPSQGNVTSVDLPKIGRRGPNEVIPAGSYEFHYKNGLPGQVSAIRYYDEDHAGGDVCYGNYAEIEQLDFTGNYNINTPDDPVTFNDVNRYTVNIRLDRAAPCNFSRTFDIKEVRTGSDLKLGELTATFTAGSTTPSISYSRQCCGTTKYPSGAPANLTDGTFWIGCTKRGKIKANGPKGDDGHASIRLEKQAIGTACSTDICVTGFKFSPRHDVNCR